MLKYLTYLPILKHDMFWYMQDNNIYDFEAHFRKYFGNIMQESATNCVYL